jgi:hypothetical protein
VECGEWKTKPNSAALRKGHRKAVRISLPDRKGGAQDVLWV